MKRQSESRHRALAFDEANATKPTRHSVLQSEPRHRALGIRFRHEEGDRRSGSFRKRVKSSRHRASYRSQSESRHRALGSGIKATKKVFPKVSDGSRAVRAMAANTKKLG